MGVETFFAVCWSLLREKKVVVEFSKYITQVIFYLLALTHLDELCFHDGNSLLHILAAGNEIPDSVTVLNQFLPHIKISGRSSIMSRQNFAGRTPLDMDCDYKIRRLLEWSDAQEGFYYLLSPHVVLLMYTTENREGTEQESQSIERAFPEFNIPITKVENPTRQDMTSAILNSVEGRDDVSALIVIIMSHGAQGVVCATDGDVSIQDVLLQMQGAVAQPGRPKVCSQTFILDVFSNYYKAVSGLFEI